VYISKVIKMEKEIHHVCRCMKKTYTLDEWCEYMKEDRQEVVFKFKDFCFNAYDMCLTPHIKISWTNNCCSFEIATAQSDNGRWSFGLYYKFGMQGGGWSAAYVDKLEDGFKTEKEAAFAGLNYIEENCQRATDELKLRAECTYDDDDNAIKGSSLLPKFKEAMRKIRSFKETFNPMQLELF